MAFGSSYSIQTCIRGEIRRGHALDQSVPVTRSDDRGCRDQRRIDLPSFSVRFFPPSPRATNSALCVNALEINDDRRVYCVHPVQYAGRKPSVYRSRRCDKRTGRDKEKRGIKRSRTIQRTIYESRSSARSDRECYSLSVKLRFQRGRETKFSRLHRVAISIVNFWVTRDAEKNIDDSRKLTTFADRSIRSAAVKSHMVARARRVKPEITVFFFENHFRNLRLDHRRSRIDRRHRRRTAGKTLPDDRLKNLYPRRKFLRSFPIRSFIV